MQNFIYMIGNPFNFEKNVKAYLFFPKGGTCKRSISMKMWKDGFEPKLENYKKRDHPILLFQMNRTVSCLRPALTAAVSFILNLL